MNAVEEAIGESIGAPDTEIDPKEQKCVGEWLRTIAEARAHDENARKIYARDRKYARGDSGSEVSVTLIGSYIDILVSFIYARNPDIDVLPSDSVGESRKEQARILAKTAEVVVAKLWRDARMKRKARRWVRSALTVGIGWLKVAWVETFIGDPAVHAELRSLQQNLAEIQATERQLAEGTVKDEDQTRYELEQRYATLSEQVEREVVRGLAIDLVPAEDVQVSLDADNVVDCTTGSWIAHRFFYATPVAMAKYPDVPTEKWSKAGTYTKVKPLDPGKLTVTGGTPGVEIDAKDADTYSAGTGGGANKSNQFICIWEVMDASNNQVFTVAEGMDCYLQKPESPNVTTERFFNLFPLALTECDGERHPQSLVTRSYKLMDEYNRTRSGLSKHRRRAKITTLFDVRNISPKDVGKVVKGAIMEFIGIKPIGDGTVQSSFHSFDYPKIDMALYDTSPIRSELEAVWGIQEALTSSIQVAKTATEAEIQQSGTQARTGAMRDALEQQLTEIATFTLEIAMDRMDMATVQAIAGPEAFWLNSGDPEDGKATLEHLDAMVGLEIRAGSTGKPNTTAQREAWGAVHPIMASTIKEVGMLRRSSPLDIAQCLEELAIETLERTGDRLDINRFMPQVGQPVTLIDPATGMPVLAHPDPNQPEQPGVPSGGGGPGVQMPAADQGPGAETSPAELPANLAAVPQ